MIEQNQMEEVLLIFADKISETVDGDVAIFVSRSDGYLGLASAIARPEEDSGVGIIWSSAIASRVEENLGLLLEYLDLLAPDDQPFQKINMLKTINKQMQEMNEAVRDHIRMLKETVPVEEVEDDSDSKAPHTLRVTSSGPEDG